MLSLCAPYIGHLTGFPVLLFILSDPYDKENELHVALGLRHLKVAVH